jgi:hypothetical protein
MSDAARHIEFEACFNFRDLGGYPASDGRQVRWNVLYRSDTLHRLTGTDAEAFAALGLRTVIDLRSRTEIEDHGQLGVAGDGTVWHNVAMLDNVKLAPRDPEEPTPVPLAAEPGEGYFRIVEQFGDSVAEVFELLAADDALPAVYHCTSGKDRTGIVSALLLEVLGVADDVIAEDYVLTERARARSTAWIQANEPEFHAFLTQIPPELRVLRPEVILGFLDMVRVQFGSARDLLAHLGVAEPSLTALRERLLEH